MTKYQIPVNHFENGRNISDKEGTGDLAQLHNAVNSKLGGRASDGTLGRPASKAWPFSSDSSPDFVGGFYDFFSGDDDFSSPPNFGTTATAICAHLAIILGGVATDELTLTVTGHSIADDGTETAADTENIVIPDGSAVDSYFQTTKRWSGVVVISVASGTAKDCNYGWVKYHTFSKQDFELTGVEVLWQSDSTDATSDIELLHHNATGWTYNAGAVPTPPTAIAAMATDYAVNATLRAGSGAWERTISQLVLGSAQEGILFRVTSGDVTPGTASFRTSSFEVTVNVKQ
jgi:hypothetical protein